MNSEIIAILCGLFLITAFFRFKSDFFILINRLASVEFRGAENKLTKTEIIVPDNSKPWTWRRAWGITLPIPRTRAGEKLLAEGNVSFKQAIVWIIFVSVIYTFLITSPSLIKNPATASLQSILILIGGSLASGLLSPISFVLITGFIHGVSKLFRSGGVWRNFFIVYIAFNAPIIILSGVAVLIYQVFSLKFALLLGMFLPFYWLLVIGPVTIKVNYRFRWLGAFLINFFVMTIFFFSTVGLYIVFNPSILQR